MGQIPITHVRFNEAEGRAKLEEFMSANRYTGTQLPRGVEPALVSAFIRKRVTPESDPAIYFRALALMRFYERQDVLPHLRSALGGEKNAGEADALMRAACVFQAIADFGSQPEISQAVVYLDQLLATHPAVISTLATMGETVIALASRGSFQRLAQRVADRVGRTAQSQHQSADSMRDYQQILALQRNDLPKIEFVLEAKQRLVGMAAPQRRSPLVATYLRRTLFSSVLMEVWAARQLRLEAMHGDPAPVYAEFARAIDEVDADRSDEPFRALVIERASQAILYLQGTLSPKHTALYQEVNRGTANFLWDYV